MVRIVAKNVRKLLLTSLASRGITSSIQLPALIKPKFTKLFINNQWRNSQLGRTFAMYNPVTKTKIAQVQAGGTADIDLAVKAACDANNFGSDWRRLDFADRGHLLNKLASLIERDAFQLFCLQTIDRIWDILSIMKKFAFKLPQIDSKEVEYELGLHLPHQEGEQKNLKRRHLKMEIDIKSTMNIIKKPLTEKIYGLGPFNFKYICM
uniref:Aldehyde dehydrogenase domain-containing protein n=1 Tax=Meloidogyne incognita TaxID=6306 RepID=A0A914MW69_MELIC